jgi:tRNA1(Val) A37 N6-methylase TrmN6
MEENRLWPRGPLFTRSPGVFPLSTDAVLLADFARPPESGAVCDLGCGTGFLLLHALWENEGLHGTGLDLLPEAVENARENLALNGLSDRGEILLRDLRDLASLPGSGTFDLALANPPYFPACAPGACPARKELTLTLPELCASAARLLRPGGRFCTVYRPERLCDLFCAAREARLEPKVMRMVLPRPGSAPSLVLFEARRDAKCGLDVLPPLFLEDADGGPSAEYRRIYRMEREKQ